MSESIEFIPLPPLQPYQEEFFGTLKQCSDQIEILMTIPKEILDGVSINPNEDYFPA